MQALVIFLATLALHGAQIADPPDWHAGLPEESWPWIASVAERTREPVQVIAAAVWEESRGVETSLSYCGKWRINPPNKKGVVTLSCAKQLSCSSGNCKKYWKDRLDLGPYGLRQPAWKRTLNGVTYIIKAWRWVGWFNRKFGENRGPECLMQWECASDVMVAVINHQKTAKPKRCRGSKWPKELGAWMAWYAGTGPMVGCSTREKRLDSAFLGIPERIKDLKAKGE